MRRSVAVRETHGDYRQRLLEKRQDVLAGLGTRFDSMAGMGPIAEDDQAQIAHTEFLSLHRNRMDYAQLRLVDQALDRIESGDYGICLGCEHPIAPKRLMAVSWAQYCLKCQEEIGAGAARP